MSRQVLCRKYNKELPGLSQPPFPGPDGQAIYESVSEQAWQEWLNWQTMLINEKQLPVLEPSTQTFLREQREKFLNNESIERVQGYQPVGDQPATDT